MEKKKLTVITTLYNKAQYLEDWAKGLAIQTCLDQTKILVLDDASTDGSLDLVKKYVEQYNLPAVILRNKKNKGLLYTIRLAYRKLDTPYFAVLDADDYYISPHKLRKSLDFLENHPEYTAYASNFYMEKNNGERNLAAPPEKTTRDLEKVSDLHIMQTCCATFRNFFTPALLKKIDYFTEERKFGICEGDAFRVYYALGKGKFRFENSPDAVWRCNILNFLEN